MKFIVTSREDIQRGLLVKQPYVVISIRDPGKPKARVRRPGHCRGVLFLDFHDAEPADRFALPQGIKLMTPDDAAAIRQFFQEHQSSIGAVVVHCEQGMSRSPAVARALAQVTGGNSSYFQKHYQPNAYVFRLMMDAFSPNKDDIHQNRSHPMESTIPQPQTTFNLRPFAERWFQWTEINACFWPGPGRQAVKVNPILSPVRTLGGVYLIAWSQQPPETFVPCDRAVQYVGETGDFCDRMNRFRSSAGIRWKDRYKGHSAAYRWPQGQSEHLWVGFFPVGKDLQPHLAEGMRVWMEAVAQEEYRLVHGNVPPLNQGGKSEITLDAFIAKTT